MRLPEELGLCTATAGSVGEKAGYFALMDYEQQSNVDSNSMTNASLSKKTDG